jgi:hypothetical protein
MGLVASGWTEKTEDISVISSTLWEPMCAQSIILHSTIRLFLMAHYRKEVAVNILEHQCFV